MKINEKNHLHTASQAASQPINAAFRNAQLKSTANSTVHERTRPQGQPSGEASIFEKELRARVGQNEHSPSNSATRSHEQKSSRAFSDLLNGTKNGATSRSFETPNTGRKATDAHRASTHQEFASRSSIDSVFWQRDQIEDAVVQNGFSNPTDFHGFETAPRQNANASLPRSAAAASLQAPETRASLLNIIRAQGPGRTLNLFA